MSLPRDVKRFIISKGNQFVGQYKFMELIRDIKLASAGWDIHKKDHKIMSQSCGRGEFSYRSVQFTFVCSKFKDVFKGPEMWADGSAFVKGLTQLKLLDRFIDMLRGEVRFSQPGLNHSIQVTNCSAAFTIMKSFRDVIPEKDATDMLLELGRNH